MGNLTQMNSKIRESVNESTDEIIVAGTVLKEMGTCDEG